MTAVIACRSLSRWNGPVMAVNDLTTDFAPGITGLLGPNGAGKTTLFRMAIGLARPGSGDIRVLGEDPWDNPGLLRRIGYVPDGPAPWPALTGAEALTRVGRLTGMTRAQAAGSAATVLKLVGLQQAADKRVGAYSRGMQQRLKFGFALVHDPELLLLDEPLFATDPLTRRDLIQLVKELAERSTSVILSTHVLTDVEALTQRVALMNHGRLLAHGDVADIRALLDRHPRTVRVGTPAPRELGHALWALESIQSLEAAEGGLIVRTRDPQAFFQDLQDVLAAKDLPFTSITPLDENVEAIFRYMVSER